MSRFDAGKADHAHVKSGPVKDVGIFDIQGTQLRSPLKGQRVRTQGVVTAVDRKGFCLQDPEGDGDPRTSDAIDVFTGKPPNVAVGDRVSVEGTVFEHSFNETELPVTQLGQGVKVERQGETPLPQPLELDAKGRRLPTRSIKEATDFYSSMAGMRVHLASARVVGPTNRHGDVYVVPESSAELLSPDGILRGAQDNTFPQRLRVKLDPALYPKGPPKLNVGDRLTDVEGTLRYGFGFFGIQTSRPVGVKGGGLRPQVTSLVGTETAMTVASLNLENADPKVEDPAKMSKGNRPDDDLGSGKLARLAKQIADNLRGPDVVSLQEVQDSDGAEKSNVVDAAETWRTLIELIAAAGGPRYEYIDRPPENGAEGGQPGGNIRNGYLYNPKRVEVVKGSVSRIGEDDEAFGGTRKSLAATFRFKPTGKALHIVNNHLSSMRGSTPTYAVVPKVIRGEEQRSAQQGKVIEHLSRLQEKDPNLRALSLGDFNAPEYTPPLVAHGSGILFNVGTLAPDGERYSHLHEGCAEPLDHQFATRNLEGKIEFEYVHVNAAFAEEVSDHDPSISRVQMS